MNTLFTHFNVMEDHLFIEGIVASLMFPITKFTLQTSNGKNFFWYLFFSWAISWYLRKLSQSLYLHYKDKYKWNTWFIKLYIPNIFL